MIAGQTGLAPQPALSSGNPPAEYFLSSLDFRGAGDHRIGVWAMTRRAQVGAGGMPVLSSIVINSEAYADPPKAPPKGATSVLDSGDDRMQQAEFSGGTVWGELTTAVLPSGDSAVRAGGAWFQVKPKLGATGITGASIVRQGYVAAVPDPASGAAWLATEYVPPKSSQTTNGARDWGTRVLEVPLG